MYFGVGPLLARRFLCPSSGFLLRRIFDGFLLFGKLILYSHININTTNNYRLYVPLLSYCRWFLLNNIIIVVVLKLHIVLKKKLTNADFSCQYTSCSFCRVSSTGTNCLCIITVMKNGSQFKTVYN